jgi:glycerophosphoryl diester phosphodiesterase
MRAEWWILSANGTSSIEVYAHRCIGFGHPENSLMALRAALQSSVHGVEIDVRLTKDLKWVTLHDPLVKSEELRVLRVHDHNYSYLRRVTTPLETMLAVISSVPDKHVLIDVKDIGEEKTIIKLIRQYELLDRATVIAWEPEVLRRIHARDQQVRLGFSYVPIHSTLRYVRGSINKPLSRYGWLLHFNAMHSFDVKHTVGVSHQHYLSSLPDLPLVSIQVPAHFCTTKLVRLAHEKNIKVIPFAVNPLNYLLLRRRGINGLITNYPQRF